jgi:hypothetical protein
MFLLARVYTYGQLDYKSFQGKEASIAYSKIYKFVNLFSYGQRAGVDDSVIVRSYGAEVAEEGVIRKHADLLQVNTTDSSINKIFLRSRLTIEVDNRKHVFVKYRVAAGGKVPSNFQVMDLIFDNGRWIENPVSSGEIDTLKELLQIASVDLIFLLHNKRDDPKLPEINASRAAIRNEAGLIDAKLLVKVIRENKGPLAKYLE